MKNHGNSDRFMLILYGHGPLVAGQTFLVKENPRSSLQLEELKEVLSPYFGPSRKLDILACQNCVMNGVETAYEVKDYVDLMIGSQGLVLNSGWPYDKLISILVNNPTASPDDVSHEALKVCARHMIDFSVMDHSSEQSVCNLRRLGHQNDIAKAIRRLVYVLQKGLDFQKVKGQKVLRYPVICDAVKLARLEAQSYWGESFVDLYDFCERLLKKCNEAVRASTTLVLQLKDKRLQSNLRNTGYVRRLKTIVRCCIAVMKNVKGMVPASYYIGSDPQYSHGLSIFFPWTLPGEPYFFAKARRDFVLKTAFETYLKYEFTKQSDWANFLQTFYRATIRKVRRAEREFFLRDKNDSLTLGLVREEIQPLSEVLTSDLQKSGSSTGFVDHEVWSNIKNYPRRNYLSPSDCPRKIDFAGRQRSGTRKQFPKPTSPPVSYLGWNIGKLVAEVISKPTGSRNGRPGPNAFPNDRTVTQRTSVLATKRRPRKRKKL